MLHDGKGSEQMFTDDRYAEEVTAGVLRLAVREAGLYPVRDLSLRDGRQARRALHKAVKRLTAREVLALFLVAEMWGRVVESRQ